MAGKSIPATSLTATGSTPTLAVQEGQTVFYTVTGTFVGTYGIQISIDGGTSWAYMKDIDNNVSYTDAQSISFSSQVECLTRVTCSAYTSGTLVCAIKSGKTIKA